MGLAYAALAPGAVATAIGHWGTPEQQATYLPAFTGEDTPAAALAMQEPRPLFDPLELGDDGAPRRRRLYPRRRQVARPAAAECELFVVAAEPDGLGPALFMVEAGAAGSSVEAEPAMGLRRGRDRPPHTRGSTPAGRALLAEGGARSTPRRASSARSPGARWRSAPRQAVLDYVIPYVNERTAFGEPITHRQAVAFSVADIAIELEGMRLTTYLAAARPAPGRDFAREAALARSSAPARACRSAPTASSCSAATASPRSTRSSAGTATSAPSA